MRWLLIMLCLSCRSFAQEVSDFSISDCSKDSYPQFTKNRLISKTLKNDTLTLQLGMVFNCCATPEPEIRLSDDSLFIRFSDFSNDSIVDYCACDCCYELNIELIGIPNTNFRLFHEYLVYDLDSNGFHEWSDFDELKPLKNSYIFPTYNELEKYLNYSGPTNLSTLGGQRFGLWFQLENETSESPFTMMYYVIDENGKGKIEWLARFNSDAKLIDISKRTGSNDMSVIMGGTYYEMFGIHIIKD